MCLMVFLTSDHYDVVRTACLLIQCGQAALEIVCPTVCTNQYSYT
jgi:hypothetical protein